jgi:hypothetical protein
MKKGKEENVYFQYPESWIQYFLDPELITRIKVRVSTNIRTLKNKMILANLESTITRILDAQFLLLLHNF